MELTDRTIDTRDIESRIDELERERDALAEDGDTMDDDDRAELESLTAFRGAAQPYICDWYHGATLINDRYFREYAEELAEEVGATSDENKWPLNCIDWEKAANELKHDYTAIEHEGVTYWTV